MTDTETQAKYVETERGIPRRPDSPGSRSSWPERATARSVG